MGFLKKFKFKFINRRVFFALAILTLLIAGYMNCGDVKLGKKKNLASYSNSTFDGKFCTQKGTNLENPMNVIFMIDMSKSNTCEFTNCSSSLGTDWDGKRFEMVKNFIDNCGSAQGNRYAVLGFANHRMVVNGSNLVETGEGCTRTLFKNGQTARGYVTPKGAYDNFQTSVLKSPSSGGFVTNYEDALNCIQEVIEDDVQNTNAELLKNQFYTVFFVTDGKPTDEEGNDISPDTKAEEFAHLVSDMKANANRSAGGLYLQAVYYGKEDQQEAALDFLDLISSEGGANGTELIEHFDDSMQLFCERAESPIRVPYAKSAFAVLNLTAEMKNGILKADSDADGIPDDAESGVAKLNRRSQNSLFDPLCINLGNGCTNFQTTNCDTQEIDEIGLSKCDYQAYGLRKTVFDEPKPAYDYDNDSMPDFVEFLKGTLPKDSSDGAAYLNPLDGLTNLEKLIRGRQLNFDEVNISPDLEMNVKVFQTSSNNCSGSTEWSFSVQNNPLVKTLPYSSSNVKENELFGHAQDENLIMVYYIVRPENSSVMDYELYASAPLRMKFGASNNTHLKPWNFKFIGKIPQQGAD